MSYCVCLISLTSSGFIHVIAYIRISFFFKAEQYSVICIYHILFLHSSISGYLGYFHLLANVSNAAVNVGVQISVCVPAFTSFVYIARGRIARSSDNSMFNFVKNCHTVFHSGCTILHSQQQCKGSSLSSVLINISFQFLFLIIAILMSV